MDDSVFKAFSEGCAENLADSVEEILEAAGGSCAIGFITTDDFYGCYLAWNKGHNLTDYSKWENALYPDYLYQPLADIVDGCSDIDFCERSDEKWAFAEVLLKGLAERIKELPDGLFMRHSLARKDVLFFAAMSDGDYVEELLDASVKWLNGNT